MDLTWLHDQALVQRGAYFLGFFAVGLWEVAAPLQEAPVGRLRRWTANGGLYMTTVFTAMLMGRLGVVATAETAANRGWGLSGIGWLPNWGAFVLWALAADLFSYFAHRLMHHIPVLWRAHKVHHSDAGFDMTTQFRFHPFEAVITLGSQAALAWILAPPALAVLLFEAIRTASGFFAHANASISPAWERRIGAVLITPDLHRVHHSVETTDHDTNFGVFFSFWDRWAGTYRARSGATETGLAEISPQDSARPLQLLLMPFARRPK
ncbi:MAG: sterol desaturase family protein [Acidobacteriota bacterium]